MGNAYYVAGRSAATAATANHCGANLWNPHGTKSLYVSEVWWFQTTAAVGNQGLVRTSTIGTPGSTITPDADNATDRRAVPPSACTLGLGTFSVQPTLQTPYLAQGNTAAAIGAGFIWVFPMPIEVPAGTGLAIATPVAVVLAASDVTFRWEE
jgi:hypothetical protein